MLLDNDSFATGVHLELGTRKREIVSLGKIKPIKIEEIHKKTLLLSPRKVPNSPLPKSLKMLKL